MTVNRIRVKDLFNTVAPNYDKLNDLLSLGLHRLWKRKLLFLARPKPGERWLDLCCGTGDMTYAIAKQVSDGGSVIGIDIALQILSIANKKASKGIFNNIEFIEKDALSTGFPPAYFDGVIISYGLRNLECRDTAFKEIYRLLKPNAVLGVLDFKHISKHKIASGFQRFYLRNIVVRLAAVFGLKEHYQYLEESIKGFPDVKELKKMAYESGFSEVKDFTIGIGQMMILILRK